MRLRERKPVNPAIPFLRDEFSNLSSSDSDGTWRLQPKGRPKKRKSRSISKPRSAKIVKRDTASHNTARWVSESPFHLVPRGEAMDVSLYKDEQQLNKRNGSKRKAGKSRTQPARAASSKPYPENAKVAKVAPRTSPNPMAVPKRAVVAKRNAAVLEARRTPAAPTVGRAERCKTSPVINQNKAKLIAKVAKRTAVPPQKTSAAPAKSMDVSLYKDEQLLEKRKGSKRKASKSRTQPARAASTKPSPENAKVAKVAPRTSPNPMAVPKRAVVAKRNAAVLEARRTSAAPTVSRAERCKTSPVIDQKKAKLIAKVAKRTAVPPQKTSAAPAKSMDVSLYKDEQLLEKRKGSKRKASKSRTLPARAASSKPSPENAKVAKVAPRTSPNPMAVPKRAVVAKRNAAVLEARRTSAAPTVGRAERCKTSPVIDQKKAKLIAKAAKRTAVPPQKTSAAPAKSMDVSFYKDEQLLKKRKGSKRKASKSRTQPARAASSKPSPENAKVAKVAPRTSPNPMAVPKRAVVAKRNAAVLEARRTPAAPNVGRVERCKTSPVIDQKALFCSALGLIAKVAKRTAVPPQKTSAAPAKSMDVSLYNDEQLLKKRKGSKRKASKSRTQPARAASSKPSPENAKVAKVAPRTSANPMAVPKRPVVAKRNAAVLEAKRTSAAPTVGRAERCKTSPVIDQKKAKVIAKVAKRTAVPPQKTSAAPAKSMDVSLYNDEQLLKKRKGSKRKASKSRTQPARAASTKPSSENAKVAKVAPRTSANPMAVPKRAVVAKRNAAVLEARTTSAAPTVGRAERCKTSPVIDQKKAKLIAKVAKRTAVPPQKTSAAPAKSNVGPTLKEVLKFLWGKVEETVSSKGRRIRLRTHYELDFSSYVSKSKGKPQRPQQKVTTKVAKRTRAKSTENYVNPTDYTNTVPAHFFINTIVKHFGTVSPDGSLRSRP